jgi:phospholipid/cholesterol/gamma-HCH transport system permease protein
MTALHERFNLVGSRVSKRIESFILEVGEVSEFGAESLQWAWKAPLRVSEVIRHIEFIGNQSLGIIGLTGVFTGMAMSYQIYQGFNLVNATNLVGPTVALGIFKELGPVLTGLIIAARAGGAMAARLGTMRVTEQIDALEVMGVAPRQYLVTPRLIAAFISTPLLCAVFNFVALLGSYLICIRMLNLDEAVFWDKIQQWLEPKHLVEALVKSSVFGLCFAAICTYRGFYTTGGAKGVGDSTNQGVVHSMVLIIILDYFLTNLIAIFFRFVDGQ